MSNVAEHPGERDAKTFGSVVDLSLPFSYKTPRHPSTIGRPPTPGQNIQILMLSPSLVSCVTDITRSKPTPPTAGSPYIRPNVGKPRKLFMLFLFCFAEFMDSFIGSALYPAIRVIQGDLDVGDAEITWAFAAYSATFSAFLLISGRVSDVYSARWSFIVGAFILAAFSLGCGFVGDKITLFILRALAGVGAAMTVPSALSLIIEWFPEADEQARGIAFFGGSGALGNVFGVIIGAAFVQWATWRWILWFTAILGFAIAIASIIVVPPSTPRAIKPSWKRLDLGGVSLITASVILFIYSVTSGSTTSWVKPAVLAPLFVSVVMAIGFFVYEAAVDQDLAALPPKVWRYNNVPILIGIALLPFLWWAALFFQQMPLMEQQYGWSPIMTSIHFLPTGFCSMIITPFVPPLVKAVSPKWAIMIGLGLEFIASMILPFANSAARYYSFLIPAMAIGTVGTTIVYSGSNIAVFLNTPPEMAGVVGGVFNSALQLGIALGLAVIASITTSVNKSHPTSTAGSNPGYDGVAAGYWFILGLVILFAVLVLVFYKSGPSKGPSPDEERGFGDHDPKARRGSIRLDVLPGTSRTSIVVLPSRSSREQRGTEVAPTEKYTETNPKVEMDDDKDKEGATDDVIGRLSVRTSIITLPRSEAPITDEREYEGESGFATSPSSPDQESRRPGTARSRNSVVRFSLQLQDDNGQGTEVSDTRSDTRNSGRFNRVNSMNLHGQ